MESNPRARPVAGIAVAPKCRKWKRGNGSSPCRRNFSGSHLRIHGDAACGNGVECVLADRLVEGMREIEAMDVTAAKPAEIADANAREEAAPGRILV